MPQLKIIWCYLELTFTVLNWTVVRHITVCIAKSLWACLKEKTFCSIRVPSLFWKGVDFWAAGADCVRCGMRQNCDATFKKVLINHRYCWLAQSCSSGHQFPCICTVSILLTYLDTLKMETGGSMKTLIRVGQTVVWNWGLWLSFSFISPASKTESQTICDVRKFRRRYLQNIQCMCGIVMQSIGICVSTLYLYSQFKIRIHSLIVTWWMGVMRFWRWHGNVIMSFHRCDEPNFHLCQCCMNFITKARTGLSTRVTTVRATWRQDTTVLSVM